MGGASTADCRTCAGSTCGMCAAGYFCLSGSRTNQGDTYAGSTVAPCPAGSFSMGGASFPDCLFCAGSTCGMCAAGYYCLAGSKTNQGDTGAGSATACPAGSYSLGSASTADCLTCAGSTCGMCAAGYYCAAADKGTAHLARHRGSRTFFCSASVFRCMSLCVHGGFMMVVWRCGCFASSSSYVGVCVPFAVVVLHSHCNSCLLTPHVGRRAVACTLAFAPVGNYCPAGTGAASATCPVGNNCAGAAADKGTSHLARHHGTCVLLLYIVVCPCAARGCVSRCA